MNRGKKLFEGVDRSGRAIRGGGVLAVYIWTDFGHEALEFGIIRRERDGRLVVRQGAPRIVLPPMQVGQATRPFGSVEEGVRVLVICDRDEEDSASEVNPDAVFARLQEERTNLRARRLLRDLRRDAVIDYR